MLEFFNHPNIYYRTNRRTISSKIWKTRQHHNKKNAQNKSNKQRRKRKHKKCNNNGRNVQTRIQRRNKPHNAMPKITIKKSKNQNSKTIEIPSKKATFLVKSLAKSRVF